MDQSANFLPVLHCLVETVLRLWSSANMFREYEHGEFEIVIEYDPELQSDALMRPLSPWLASFLGGAGASVPESEPNKSVETVRVASFSVTHKLAPGEVRLIMSGAYQSLGVRASKLEQALNLSPGSGFQLIVDVLRASVLLPDWDYEAQVEVRDAQGHVLSGPPRQWISLYIERPLAVELAASSNLSLEGAADYLLLARREARAG